MPDESLPRECAQNGCQYEAQGYCPEHNYEIERRQDMAALMMKVLAKLNVVLAILGVSGAGLLGAYAYATLIWQTSISDTRAVQSEISQLLQVTSQLNSTAKHQNDMNIRTTAKFDRMMTNFERVADRQLRHEQEIEKRFDAWGNRIYDNVDKSNPRPQGGINE